jgi:hypothetical protein
MELKEYLTDEMIDNIYNEYSNVYVIKYDNDAQIDGLYFGRLLLKVNLKDGKDKKPFITINSYVEFSGEKMKWKNGTICLVDPYWVKKYRVIGKLKVRVKVLRSKADKDSDTRSYFVAYENVNLTFKQFIKRRLNEEYRKSSYIALEAYSNFQMRRKQVGYYKALNETSKHYLLEHNLLKDQIIPKLNNSMKKYKKEWDDLYLQSLENDKAKLAIDKLIKDGEERNFAEIIDFSERFRS